MAEERIERKDLWQGLENIRQNDWGKVARKLGLDFNTSWGRGSHAVIRNPQFPDPSDIRGFITTIQKSLGKQHNQRIFKFIHIFVSQFKFFYKFKFSSFLWFFQTLKTEY